MKSMKEFINEKKSGRMSVGRIVPFISAYKREALLFTSVNYRRDIGIQQCAVLRGHGWTKLLPSC